MDDYHRCDLCGLNRGTLHLDEVVDGAIRLTAHLCDDCWYRLGIRVPLGNIWRHIKHHKEQMLPPELDPTSEVEAILAEKDLHDLIDTSPLAVADPDNPEELDSQDLDALLAEEAGERVEPEIEDSESTSDTPTATPDSRQLGIDAVRIPPTHPSLVALVAFKLLQCHKAIPIKLEGERLTVAFANPFDMDGIRHVDEYLKDLNLSLVVAFADEREIVRELNRHGGPPHRFESLS